MTPEPRETRLRRMKMRSIRRGIKEMDLLMGAFAETRLAALSEADLDLYDRLLEENDHDIYAWVAGRAAPPEVYAGLVAQLSAALDSARDSQ